MTEANVTPQEGAAPPPKEESAPPAVHAGGSTDYESRFNGLMSSFNKRGSEIEALKSQLEAETAAHLATKARLQNLEAEKLQLLQQSTTNVEAVTRDRDEVKTRLQQTEAELKTLRAVAEAGLGKEFAALIRPTTDEAELGRQVQAALAAQNSALESARAQLRSGYVPPNNQTRTVPTGFTSEAEIKAYLDGAGDNWEERARRRQEVISTLQKPSS
jgi:chromosome segregation ATPase